MADRFNLIALSCSHGDQMFKQIFSPRCISFDQPFMKAENNFSVQFCIEISSKAGSKDRAQSTQGQYDIRPPRASLVNKIFIERFYVRNCFGKLYMVQYLENIGPTIKHPVWLFQLFLSSSAVLTRHKETGVSGFRFPFTVQ